MDISIVINNAGILEAVPSYLQDKAAMVNMITLNACGPMLMMREFGQRLMGRATRSAIINVASVAAYGPLPGLSLYSATKAFLKSLTLSAYKEMKDNVDVLALCPGPIKTKMLNETMTIDGITADRVVEKALSNLGYVEEINPSALQAMECRVILEAQNIHMKIFLFFAAYYVKFFKS